MVVVPQVDQSLNDVLLETCPPASPRDTANPLAIVVRRFIHRRIGCFQAATSDSETNGLQCEQLCKQAWISLGVDVGRKDADQFSQSLGQMREQAAQHDPTPCLRMGTSRHILDINKVYFLAVFPNNHTLEHI